MPIYALRASSVGFGGPPAPAHIVSSSMMGPRGANGASPFMYAQPDRDIDSTPHASPTPRSPALIACATLMVALSDEAQNRLSVAPVTLSGNPAASAAQRPTSPMPSCAGFTQPATMSSIWSRPTPTRSHAPFIVIPSRSSSRKWDKELPYRANGVRTPPSTKASVIVDLLRVNEMLAAQERLLNTVVDQSGWCYGVGQGASHR